MRLWTFEQHSSRPLLPRYLPHQQRLHPRSSCCHLRPHLLSVPTFEYQDQHYTIQFRSFEKTTTESTLSRPQTPVSNTTWTSSKNVQWIPHVAFLPKPIFGSNGSDGKHDGRRRAYGDDCYRVAEAFGDRASTSSSCHIVSDLQSPERCC